MEQVLRQTWAFFFRDYHLTRRYMSWVIVFTFYAVVNTATIALIGVALGDRRLTLLLILGALLWNFLSVLFSEIANSITYERWEGTLEYTFMAPVRLFWRKWTSDDTTMPARRCKPCILRPRRCSSSGATRTATIVARTSEDASQRRFP